MPIIFEASNTGFFSTLVFPFLLGLGLIGLALFLNKKEVAYENRNLKNLFFLFSLFGIVLCFIVAAFSAYNLRHFQAVELHPTQLKVEDKLLDFKDIKRVFVKEDFQASHLSPQIIRDTTYLLIIQEESGKSYVFSDENYPVRDMVVQINEQLKK